MPLAIAVSILNLIVVAFLCLKAIKILSFRQLILLMAAILLWQLYIYQLSFSGILRNFDFPPRFFVYLILPAFLFSFVFLFYHRNRPWLQQIEHHQIIYLQSFRVAIEVLFVEAVHAGILHQEVAVLGYDYDLFFALTAIPMGLLLKNKKVKKSLLLLWNYLGLLIILSILFLFVCSVYYPQLFGASDVLLPKEFADYPYAIIPGFLVPTAFFLHLLSIFKTISNKGSN